MKEQTLITRLDDRLNTAAYADVDASMNGLQVGSTDGHVDTVAVAVDAAMATIDTAREREVDLLLTHHGISWGGIDRVTGREYAQIESLISADIELYVSHLPLDGHQQLGNAVGLGDHINVNPDSRTAFGELGSVTIGCHGSLEDPVSVETLQTRLETIHTDDQPVQVLPFGPDSIESIAIVTGSGADWLDEAAAAGVDAFVTGEGKQQIYHEARERGVNVFLAGHYATETFGIKRVAETIESWGVETTFIDHPTGL
ncbi:MAG: dinuclear metal center protein, YbgI/SA1388 family [Haloquadratum walsbyi J07HQW1]|jgi:dinuclear metal center protein, YbgI/SA1388 family|uniref:Dinuclear metal center protein, YbgI/SA1388 family n=1 Tax=Haloquadratum walsbyi J07HQW1 TaxID=1238424 RepID=U1MRP7_9EURY|nr:MAG: dinuclear metal center protein, YbgI/SA1388 family [Haloquadratum walsbyi J07HQW1]